MKILLFTSPKNGLTTKLSSIDKQNSYVVSHYDDLVFELPNKNRTDISIKVTGVEINEFDLVYFRNAMAYQKYTTSIVQYLDYYKIPYIDNYNKNVVADDKLLQMILLQYNEISTPKTIVLSPSLMASSYEYLLTNLGEKFIVKESGASHGNLNFLIKNEREFNKVIKDNPTALFVCQEYIPNDYDYRLVTLGYEVKVIKKRSRTNTSSHLNNRFQGAIVEFVEMKGLEEIISTAQRAAKLYKTEVAGVDIVVSKETNKFFVLEINRAPDVADEQTLTAIQSYLSDKILTI